MVLIDFEYNRSADKDMGLVCCCLQVDDGPIERYWLDDGSENERLTDRIIELADHIFVGYAIQMAECRCFYALGLDPRQFKWRDLYSEYKWLSNADDRWSYGKFTLTKTKAECVYRFKPSVRKHKRMSAEEEDMIEKIKKEEEEAYTAERGCKCVTEKCDMTLLSIEYHYGLLTEEDVEYDYTVKSSTRKLILSGFRLDLHKVKILDYCASDIHLLGELARLIMADIVTVSKEPHLTVVRGEVKEITPEALMPVEELALNIGHWCAQNAVYAMRGIQLDKGKLEAVLKAAQTIKTDLQLNWNVDHPDYTLYRIGSSRKDLATFKMLRTQSPYKKMEIKFDNDLFTEMASSLEKIGEFKWKRTLKGAFAGDKEYLEEVSGGSKDGVIYHLLKHKDAITAIKSMTPDKDGTVKLLSYIGSDFKQRPNFNPYGTKTGRNAASSTSFIFLGPKWMRILASPKYWYCDLDAHSEEVAIAASVYDDDNKRSIYRSPDVYMKYAQLAGTYPADKPILTEEQRKSEAWFSAEGWDTIRQMYKKGTLGMQFGMGGQSLRQSVLLSLPKEKRGAVDEDWGFRFVEEYHNTFSKEYAAVTLLKELYSDRHEGLILADGWRLGPDEDNILTVANFPVQGTGAVILRKCCQFCDDSGIQIYATLHDAISIMGKDNMEGQIKIASECFRKAAVDVLGEDLMLIGEPEIVKHGEPWIHEKKAKGAWNRMAEHCFPEFVIK